MNISLFIELLFNSLVLGVLIALVAIGFNIIFGVTKVFHIAHGAVYVSGAYVFWWFLECGFNVIFVLAALVIVTSFLAVVIERLVYQPLYKKKSSQAITLISSMGVYIFLTNLLALLFGNQTISARLDLGGMQSAGNLFIDPIQVFQLGVGVIIIGLFFCGLRSSWFLKIRAVVSEADTASVIGVNIFKLRYVSMIIGSLLAVVTAVLYFYDGGLSPQSGMQITLTAVVAVIIGGTDSYKGTIAASLLIALLQTGTEWYLSSQWKEGVTFLLLIAVLLWRTEGILSFKLRVEEQ